MKSALLIASRVEKIVRRSSAAVVLLLAVGCASITRGRVGHQVQKRDPYSTDELLAQPWSRSAWARRVTAIAASAIRRAAQRRAHNDMDHRSTLADVLSVTLPGSPDGR